MQQIEIDMELAHDLMNRAVSEGVFPGATLLVARAGSIVFFRAYGYANLLTRRKVTEETLFDLASLTKPLATTLAVMHLVERGDLDLEQTLGSVLPQCAHSPKGRIKLKHLLYHNSGLADYAPYYIRLRALAREARPAALKKLLLSEPLAYPIGERVVYSDLGFMLLRWVVECTSQQRLDRFVAEQIYRPLGLADLFFAGTGSAAGDRQFAATERCPWRQRVLEGEVHDDNAHVMGGVDGHAGLFGDGAAVYRLLAELLAGFHGQLCVGILKRETIARMFARRPEIGRTLGFDTPSTSGSSAGRFFSRHSVGHLGFTGTSFWMDLERDVIVILLTNRVHPTRQNQKIKAFRPGLHDAVMTALSTYHQS